MPQLDKFIFFSQYFWLFLLLFVSYFLLIKWVLPSLFRTLKARKLHLLSLREQMEERPGVVGLSGLPVIGSGVVRSSAEQLSALGRFDPILSPLTPLQPLFPRPLPLFIERGWNRLLRLTLLYEETPFRFLKAVYLLPRLYPALTDRFKPLPPPPHWSGINFLLTQRPLLRLLPPAAPLSALFRLLSLFYFDLYLLSTSLLLSSRNLSSHSPLSSLLSLHRLSTPLSAVKLNFSKLSGFHGL